MLSSRQLAAIMFTDIVGYTALMGRDEQKAIQLLAKNRQIQKPIIEQFNGRWIKELGDGVMASFNTASDAVCAAIKIQQSCNASKNFQLRIGIHLGEVLFENEDVFGDGVNIASRIQTITNPGSIFISETVHKSIANIKLFQTAFVKEQQLKNVKEPMRIFQVLAEGVVKANVSPVREKIKQNRVITIVSLLAIILLVAIYFYPNIKNKNEANEKSIAILAFDDMSPQKDHEYLSDGLAEEIINSISIIKDLKVIGRTSSFQFKGKGLDEKSIGEKLDVSNVLSGSIQLADNILRITTTLIRVKDNKVMWSQQFDKEPKDIFAIQDSIAYNIVEKLKLTLSESEKPRLIKKETGPAVYAEYLKGFLLYKRNEFENSIDYFQRAISGDSVFAPSHAYLALAKIWIIYRAGTFGDFNAIREAKGHAYDAIRLDPDLAEAYSALALCAWTIELDFASAKLNFERSIQLNPSSSLIKSRYAYFLSWMGDFDKAERLGLDAISSDPADFNGYMILSIANIYKKNFSEAEKYIAEGQKLFPENRGFENQYILSRFYAGDYDKVIEMIKPMLSDEKTRNSADHLCYLSVAYFKKGDLAESKKILRLLHDTPADRNASIDFSLARVYAQYQMKDSCFLSLERAFLDRQREFRLLKIDPLFDPVRQDQRYKDLYHRYGFDRYK